MLQMLQNAAAWGGYLIKSPLITVPEVAGRCPTQAEFKSIRAQLR